jgi:hypothetical protein
LKRHEYFFWLKDSLQIVAFNEYLQRSVAGCFFSADARPAILALPAPAGLMMQALDRRLP